MRWSWYLHRLRKMSAGEIGVRLRDAARRRVWRRRRWPQPALAGAVRWHGCPIAAAVAGSIPAEARSALLAGAAGIMAGRVELFGYCHDRLGEDPDWFLDIRSGRRAPSTDHAFSIPYRDAVLVGDNKFVWEPSRHGHLTQLAMAYWLTGDEAFAARVALHLSDWWQRNPPLTGMHWTSGIELGMRLIAWCWIRRLLDGWSGAKDLFEHNPVFQRQLWVHQHYLATFESPGSSANNHLIAELAGLFIAATAFPLFRDSAVWQARSRRGLEHEIGRQSFPDGVNREQASEYHPYVLELFLLAVLEADGAETPVRPDFSPAFGARLVAMADALAAMLDSAGRPPRQGDGDGAHGLLVDGADFDRCRSLLAGARHLFGAPGWWPDTAEDCRSVLWAAVGTERINPLRPVTRPTLFPDAGMAILRDLDDRPDALWCRCDHGPHGFLSIAAHGHADALSLELRCGGVEILADPGTSSYAGEPEWRRWERSTAAHNTLELFGVDQAESGGPFLWVTEPRVALLAGTGLDTGEVAYWQAEHDGYARSLPGLRHRRSVRFDRWTRRFTIADSITAGAAIPARLCFQFGPQVTIALDGATAMLSWAVAGARRSIALALPAALDWRLHSGSLEPRAGWYAPGFGRRVAAPSLIGSGKIDAGQDLLTQFDLTGAAAPDRAVLEESSLA